MGNCTAGSRLGYEELKESVPGSLVDEHDFDLFYSLCKTETVGTLSMELHPSKTQLFYVVVSGQVVVHLSSPKVPNVCATTFFAGDMIHFFNSPLQPVTSHDHSCLVNGNVKLSLQFKGYTEKMGRVIGMDRLGWETFLRTRDEFARPLQSLLSISIADFVGSSRNFAGVTAKQAQMLGPLLKIRTAERGGLVCFPVKQNRGIAKNYTSGGSVAVLLAGAVVSMSSAQSVDSLIERLRKDTPSTSLGSRERPNGGRHSIFSSSALSRFMNRKGSVLREDKEASARSVRSSTHSATFSLADSTKDGALHGTERAGTILGLDTLFLRQPEIPTHRYVVTSHTAVVGYAPPFVLDAFSEVDPRFLRLIARNYYRALLDAVKNSIPMLSGMEETSYAKLCAKVGTRGFSPGTIICERDQPGEFAYIVVHGAVTVAAGSSELTANPSAGSVDESPDLAAGDASLTQILTWGNMFGDVSLMTNSPYFNTVTALEPTVTLTISKPTLDEIYFENKAKICELRIRQVGRDVDMQHVIDHPRGSEAFRQYLTKAMAVENLQFYLAVDRFDSMCVTITKTYAEIRKLRQRIDKTKATMDALSAPLRRDASLIHGGASVAPTTITEATNLTQDEKNNSDYMARLFAELDSKVLAVQAQHHADTPSPRDHHSDGSDGEDTDTNDGDSHYDLPVQMPLLNVQQPSFSNAKYASSPIHATSGGSSKQTYPPGASSSTDHCEVVQEEEEATALADLPVKVKPHAAERMPSASFGMSAALSSSDLIRVIPDRLRLFAPKTVPTATAPLTTEDEQATSPSSLPLRVRTPVSGTATTLNETAKELHAKVQRRMGKLRQSVFELREVARKIVETFVVERAPSQVNISAKTRTNLERTFHEWSARSYGAEPITRRRSFQLQRRSSGSGTHSDGNLGVVIAAFHAENAIDCAAETVVGSRTAQDEAGDVISIDFTTLFAEAKSEVLKLLKYDNFPRWQRTPEFAAFIDMMVKHGSGKHQAQDVSNSIDISAAYGADGHSSPSPSRSDRVAPPQRGFQFGGMLAKSFGRGVGAAAVAASDSHKQHSNPDMLIDIEGREDTPQASPSKAASYMYYI